MQDPTTASPSLSQIQALLSQLEAGTGTGSVFPAAPAAVSNPLSSLSIAEAESLGLLLAGFLNTLNARVPASGGLSNQFSVPTANDFHRGKSGTSSDDTPWSVNAAVSSGGAPSRNSTGPVWLGINELQIPSPATAVVQLQPSPTPINLGGPTPTGTAPASDNELLAVNADDDSGSDYSDEDEDDEAVGTQQLLAEPAPWTVARSSTMAETSSQATATAEAVSALPSPSFSHSTCSDVGLSSFLADELPSERGRLDCRPDLDGRGYQALLGLNTPRSFYIYQS